MKVHRKSVTGCSACSVKDNGILVNLATHDFTKIAIVHCGNVRCVTGRPQKWIRSFLGFACFRSLPVSLEEPTCSKSADDSVVFAANHGGISPQPALSCRDFLMELRLLTFLLPIKVHINQRRAAVFTLCSLLAV